MIPDCYYCGRVPLRVGDVIMLHGSEYAVYRVTDCSASVVGLTRKMREVKSRFGDGTKQFFAPPHKDTISATTEPGTVLRRIPNFAEQWQQQQNNKTKGNEMKTKTEKAETKKGGSASEPSPGALGGFNGHSIASVLRRLGKEGVSIARGRAIMAAMKIKVSDPTVATQINAGVNKQRGEPAALTSAQLKELLNAAPEPVPARKEIKTEKVTKKTPAKK